jgi:hypothetical protein
VPAWWAHTLVSSDIVLVGLMYTVKSDSSPGAGVHNYMLDAKQTLKFVRA